MPQLVTEYYDLNLLFEQVGKEESSLHRFVEIFLSTVPADLESLRKAIDNKDYNISRSAAHKMKSSFMLMGAEWARDICYEMENIARTEEEIEKLPEKYEELSNKLSKMIAMLKKD